MNTGRTHFKEGNPGRKAIADGGSPNKPDPVEEAITGAVQWGGSKKEWDALWESAKVQAKRGRPALLLGLLEYAARAKPRGIEVAGTASGPIVIKGIPGFPLNAADPV